MAASDAAYFEAIPWCSSLLSNPQYNVTSTSSREPKSSTEDALFAETFNTPSTISACLSLYKTPTTSEERIAEVRTLLALDSGLNGYPNVCHGGVTATILDEVIGLLLLLNKDRDEAAAKATGKLAEFPAAVTAELTVRYLKPVMTPQVVCVVGRLVKVEGRKIWMRGSIEDHAGIELVRAECLYVQIGRHML